MKISYRPLDVTLSNLRFYGFGYFRYRPKVSANFQFRFRYRSLNQKGGFGRTLLCLGTLKTGLFLTERTLEPKNIQCNMYVILAIFTFKLWIRQTAF